jgi:predicted PurR-regulated permease PerM
LTAQWARWLVVAAVLVLLGLGAFEILKPFMSPIAWAAALCVMTWPLYRRLRSRLGNRDALAAFAMTLLLLVSVVLPVISASWLLSEEIMATVKKADALLASPPEPPDWVRGIPFIGPRVEEGMLRWKADPRTLQSLLLDHGSSVREFVLSTAGRVGRNVVKIVLTLLTAYFFFRYGEEMLAQTRTVTHRITGERAQPWLQIVGDTIRAVVYGLLMTALAQGVLAGLGYWASGVPAPVLLCAATCFLALIPFGAPLVWVPAGIWLLTQDRLVPGLGLLAWGALVVSTIDNILRPYFISGATRTPYLLVFFGVLGGIGEFGLVGVFIGPTILAVLLALWRKWASEHIAPAEAAEIRAGAEPLVEGVS